MTTDLYAEEARIEQSARDMGVNRHQEETRKKIEGGQESGTHYGAALLRRSVEPVAEAIEAFATKARGSKGGRYHVAVKFLELIPFDVAAYLTSKQILDSYSHPEPLARIASRIGQTIEDEVRYADFQKQAPGLWNQVSRQTDRDTDRRKRIILNHTYQKHVDAWDAWKATDRLHLGTKLIEIFTEATGFSEIKMKTVAKGKTTLYLHPTPEVVEWIERSSVNASLLSPSYMPMVVPPRDWNGPHGGGYLYPQLRPLTLVKTRNRAYLSELASIPEQLEDVYSAVNRVQSVPWQVNSGVMDVMLTLWEKGATIAKLPARDEVPVTPFPFPDIPKEDLTDDQKETVKAWKREAAQTHEANAKLRSKRVHLARILGLAKSFAKYDRIYFPHSLDFRGRIYAVPLFLNPQGSDISKGLLHFGEAKPIGDTTGPGWLAIHGANVWGYDKVSLEDRIEWVEEHSDRIAAIGEDPFSDYWWTEADKPWCFLAFCMEWAGFLREGADWQTRLPIALDGSCSGLQHYSAALRDEIGGAAVNLTPSDTPSDVYQEVADKVVEKLRLDLPTSGQESQMAARCLDFGIDRKTTKRPTMTLPYGSTRFSCRSFVLEWMSEKGDELERQGKPNPLKGREMDHAGYLSGIVWESIGEVVIAASSAMAWLREVASSLAAEQLPVTWTTPDGLPLVQEYKDTTARRVKTRFGAKLVYLSLREDQDTLDRRRQANGVAPNWVHSMDATHLRMVVNYAALNGVSSFAVIHDSFGAHACDTDMLSACLREAMVDLYKDDVLARFRDEVCAILPTSEHIPPLPQRGNLDINDLKESDYVFA